MHWEIGITNKIAMEKEKLVVIVLDVVLLDPLI